MFYWCSVYGTTIFCMNIWCIKLSNVLLKCSKHEVAICSTEVLDPYHNQINTVPLHIVHHATCECRLGQWSWTSSPCSQHAALYLIQQEQHHFWCRHTEMMPDSVNTRSSHNCITLNSLKSEETQINCQPTTVSTAMVAIPSSFTVKSRCHSCLTAYTRHHVVAVSKVCYSLTCDLHHIRKLVAVDIAKMVACSIINSWISYCNLCWCGVWNESR